MVGVEHVGEDQRLFLWDRENGIQDLGSVSGDQLAINNAGQIAGTMIDPNGNKQAFFWEPGQCRTMLGTLGGRMSVALAMNNNSRIVGISYNAADSGRVFLWDRATGMKELPRPEPGGYWPVSINDHGQIFVLSHGGGKRPNRWYIFDANGPTRLDVPPPDASPGNMNNHGWVAAVSKPAGKQPHLFLYNERGPLKRLFPASVHAVITRLNDSNQVACTTFVRDPWDRWRGRLLRPRRFVDRSFSYLWDPERGRIPLDRYVPDAERFLVMDLNNKGCLIGTACTNDGRWRTVLLEPIRERWGK